MQPRRFTRLVSIGGAALTASVAVLAIARILLADEGLKCSYPPYCPTPCLPLHCPTPTPPVCDLSPKALAVDSSPTATSDADGVMEPGETAVVMPSWGKTVGSVSYRPPLPLCSASLTEAGSAATLTGPAAGDYAISVEAAQYGAFSNPTTLSGPNATQCAGCYAMSVMAPSGRPAPHWDASFTETLDGTLTHSKVWTLHVGDSFTDVPRSNPFYKKIETLLHRGVTSGCGPTEFCPGQDVSRGQIAVFVAKKLAGSAANIPSAGVVAFQPYPPYPAYDCKEGGTSVFTDVAPTDMFCKHIHYIAAINVDRGCGPSLYCPSRILSRLEMATFVANALFPNGGDITIPGVPLTYTDSVTGLSYSCDPASPNVHFTDVPITDPFCKDAHYLWAKGIISGCSPTEYCPIGEVTRDQMAKFLVNAFKLTLYGP